jgi:ferrous iron transport protein B
MGVLSGLGEVEEYELSMHEQFSAFFPTGIAAVSFLVFNIYDSPCLAAISTSAKEMNNKKWFWFAIGFQNINAYLITLMVYQFGGLMTGEVAFGVGTVAAVIVLVGYLYLLFRPDPNKKKAVVEQAA